jgi:hypothetical protein
VNVLETGGRQALHNHAKSFISGVLYLTDSDPSVSTLFVKAVGSGEFVFNNSNARAKLGPYNAGKWIAPDAQAGDLLLFPSYLLHEAPQNRGRTRVSLAFDATPSRLDSRATRSHSRVSLQVQSALSAGFWTLPSALRGKLSTQHKRDGTL